MAELGELCLWAALPLMVLTAAASLGAGWTGRGDLAALGGRAASSSAVLLLISLAGFGYALVTVRLQYVYVAAFSGFQDPWYWRLAALWSGPTAGVLVFTVLVAVAAVASSRLGRSRLDSARTGALAVLSLMGLLTTLARARPFALSIAPAQMGSGLPLTMKSVPWQLEVWAIYGAVACGAFAFADVLAEQLSETKSGRRFRRLAVTLAASSLTVAVLSATWRAYGDSGRLLDITGLSFVAVHVPAWLLALSCLHAPSTLASPAWAARWDRTLAVALFPAAIGAGAALLTGMGDVPPATLWAAGFAAGIISGALSSRTVREGGVEELRSVPGFGAWAFRGGLLLLIFAGLTTVWGLLRGPIWKNAAWPVVMLALAAVAAWASSRPAGRWKKVWPASVLLAVSGAVAAYAVSGWRQPAVAVTAGLVLAILVGFVSDLLRLRAAQRSGAVQQPVARGRASRRWSSALGHLGVAVLVLGLSAEALTEVETVPLDPGDSFTAPSGPASEIQVTYLGLSRYQIGELDKRVASFSLSSAGRSELATAAMTYDMATRRQFRTPAVERGVLADVIIGISGRTGSEEGIMCRVASRPLASLVWIGGLLVLASILGRVRAIS